MNTKKLFEYMMKLPPQQRDFAVYAAAKEAGVDVTFDDFQRACTTLSNQVMAVIEIEVRGFLKRMNPTTDLDMLKALKAAQSRLCEHCPQRMDSAGEQVGDHTDECIAAMDAIEKAEDS